MGISHGNLTYHFASRAAIFEALYQQIVEQMEGAILPEGTLDLAHLNRVLHHFYELQGRYTFFFRDLVEIARHYPKMAQRHQQIMQKRVAEGRALAEYWVEAGLMYPEPTPGRYDQLAHSIWFVNTFWLCQQGVLPRAHPAQEQGYTLQWIWALIDPYLTPAGKDQKARILHS